MEQLGYYARDVFGTFRLFEWGSDGTFYIVDNGHKRVDDPNNYTILEIGNYTA